jgi:hypothetical protein
VREMAKTLLPAKAAENGKRRFLGKNGSS